MGYGAKCDGPGICVGVAMVEAPKFVLIRFKFKSLSSIVSLLEFSRTKDSKMFRICSKVVAVRAKNKQVSVLYTATSTVDKQFFCVLCSKHQFNI